MKKEHNVTKKPNTLTCISKTQNRQNVCDEDVQIDLSDMPEWTDEMFETAKRGHHYFNLDSKFLLFVG